MGKRIFASTSKYADCQFGNLPLAFIFACIAYHFDGLQFHYNDVIMGMIESQITSLTIAYSTVYSDAEQRKHQSSAPLAFVRGIHRGPVNSPHKWPVTRKMFPLDDVIMFICYADLILWQMVDCLLGRELLYKNCNRLMLYKYQLLTFILTKMLHSTYPNTVAFVRLYITAHKLTQFESQLTTPQALLLMATFSPRGSISLTLNNPIITSVLQNGQHFADDI